MAIEFKLAPLFGSGAVLCRRKEVRVWGTAADGQTVTGRVTTADGLILSEGICTARDGRFLLHLPPMEQATSCTLTVTCGAETCTSTDISIGEVYLASGQSNMELELQNADEGQDLIAAHDDPLVHYFNVPKKSVWDDDAIAAEAASHWERVRPGYARDMSAVAYFFARKLARTIDCPIGIIDCYWGGTSVTCWMDKEALEATAEGQRYITRYREQGGDKPFDQWRQEEDAFWVEMNAWNAHVAQLKKDNPGISWPEINETVGPCPWHPPVGPGSPYRPGGLIETMTKRVVPATLTGILYYQGEDDTAKTEHYDVLLTAMVMRLRQLFRDDSLPFLNVPPATRISTTGRACVLHRHARRAPSSPAVWRFCWTAASSTTSTRPTSVPPVNACATLPCASSMAWTRRNPPARWGSIRREIRSLSR